MKILFACGGTGGDIFPAVAVAKALLEREKDVEVVFVGTKRGMEKKIINQAGWRLEMIETATFADKKGLKKLLGLFPFAKALRDSFKLLKKEKPDRVVGVGGYVSAPIFIIAFFMGISAMAIEPNAVPGLANRVIKYFATRVVTAYPETQNYFGKKGVLLGVPVRKELFVEKVSGPKKVIFLFGGSLGAKTINEGILSALPYLADLKEKIHFVHQTGATVEPKTIESVYQRFGFSAEVYPFIEKMGEFYAKADLVVARSGANTVAELMALKIPSLLIPYPHARDGHQTANARSLEKLGGAKILLDQEFQGETLAKRIRELITNTEELKRMEMNLARMSATNSAEKIVEECLRLVLSS